MRIQFKEFELFEFLDTRGQIVSVRGLPLLSRIEFRGRLDRLREIAIAYGDSTLHDLYDSNTEFKRCIDRSLELFSINPECVSFAIASELIISRFDPETQEWRPGWLADLEFPPSPLPPKNEGEAPTDAEAIATLWGHIGDLQKTMDAATDPRIPGRQLIDIVNARGIEASGKEGLKKKWGAIAQQKLAESPLPPGFIDLSKFNNN